MGSEDMRRNRMPVVQNSSLVSLVLAASSRTWYPTLLPGVPAHVTLAQHHGTQRACSKCKLIQLQVLRRAQLRQGDIHLAGTVYNAGMTVKLHLHQVSMVDGWQCQVPKLNTKS